MKLHTISTYKDGDGYSIVKFCTICGAEGLKLAEECQPPKDDNRFELFSYWTGKKIDSWPEQS